MTREGRCHACDQRRPDVPELPRLPMCPQCAKAWRMGNRIGHEMGEQDGAAVMAGIIALGEWAKRNGRRKMPEGQLCQWFTLDGNDEDDSVCIRPATHSSCEGWVCISHVCRCSKPV